MSSLPISRLPEKYAVAMKATGMWKAACPVPLERLRLVAVPYLDFAGEQHSGELVCLDVAAPHVVELFRQLFDMRFPIHKVTCVHNYGGDDELSMADNNTSCFNFRPVEGSCRDSLHSYGLAIDINPRQNPFLSINEESGVVAVHPRDGWQYLNRSNQKTGMVEDVVAVFARHGFFVWGGKWTTPIDYHHFQPPRGLAELIAAMNEDLGAKLFELSINNQQKMQNLPCGEDLQPFLKLYADEPGNFLTGILGLL